MQFIHINLTPKKTPKLCTCGKDEDLSLTSGSAEGLVGISTVDVCNKTQEHNVKNILCCSLELLNWLLIIFVKNEPRSSWFTWGSGLIMPHSTDSIHNVQDLLYQTISGQSNTHSTVTVQQKHSQNPHSLVLHSLWNGSTRQSSPCPLRFSIVIGYFTFCLDVFNSK